MHSQPELETELKLQPHSYSLKSTVPARIVFVAACTFFFVCLFHHLFLMLYLHPVMNNELGAQVGAMSRRVRVYAHVITPNTQLKGICALVIV